ncbi:MAG: alcohol dehydrogenase, partial [Rhodospirillaceae bacterium]|nr:alcohol dehydrogenase [Rhodospirillaceae bacterium]
GTVVTAGLSPSTAEFSFIQSNLVAEEKAIKGSYMGSCVPVRDIPRFISLYRQGRLPVDKLISRQVGLDDLNEGFDRLQNGEAIRQICIPHGAG